MRESFVLHQEWSYKFERRPVITTVWVTEKEEQVGRSEKEREAAVVLTDLLGMTCRVAILDTLKVSLHRGSHYVSVQGMLQ